MMATAEARAVWQRTVNRYFVQEDAKRAPKFTSCQSSSSSSAASTKQVQDSVSPPPVVRPQNQSPCAPFMPLCFPHLFGQHHHHLHPNQKEQVKTPLEPELGVKSCKSESFQDRFMEWMETGESYGLIVNDESSEKKLLNELALDPTSPWNPLSSDRAGPWWRTTDKDELASLVAQRSLDFVENCDLPTPLNMKRSYYGSINSDGLWNHSVSNQTIHKHGPNSCKNRTESDLSKWDLLEALRRSQTRAREAENMAKEAYAEKEQLVKLLFKQASEVFTYKQCLKLLQLEALYLQMKSKKIDKSNEQQPHVSIIPWRNSKARKVGRKRSKRSKPNGFVGLAVGMSLVGAGLLLGWTVGWMQMLSF